MTRSLQLIVCAAALAAHPCSVMGQERGIVIAPFHTDSAVYGKAGQTLDYVDRDLRLGLLIGGDTVEVRTYEGTIVPLDSAFTPAFVLAAFRACEPGCARASQGRSQLEARQEKLELVQRALELFPDHPYTVEFRVIECRMLAPMNSERPGTEAVACVERFVSEYPEHPDAGELAWLATQLEHAVYEFEGDSGAMRTQAEAFARFAEGVSDPGIAEVARLRIARLYYMIQEVSEGEERAEARQTALDLYEVLSRSSQESVRLTAVIERFNLLEGRRIYVGPNAWTCTSNDPC